MCFSMGASFGAGAVISVIGIVTIKNNHSSRFILFAAIPLIFAIQQITEGFIWLSLQNENYYNLLKPCAYLFSVFSQIVWPAWVPISILLMEKQSGRKKILYFLSILGLLVSVSLGYHLIKFGVTAEISEHHIYYDLGDSSTMLPFISIFYVIATMLPPFISSLNRMWSLGFAILVSFIFTAIFYENYLISVWCFFAAIISGVVYFILQEIQKSALTSDAKFNVSQKHEGIET